MFRESMLNIWAAFIDPLQKLIVSESKDETDVRRK